MGPLGFGLAQDRLQEKDHQSPVADWWVPEDHKLPDMMSAGQPLLNKPWDYWGADNGHRAEALAKLELNVYWMREFLFLYLMLFAWRCTTKMDPRYRAFHYPHLGDTKRLWEPKVRHQYIKDFTVRSEAGRWSLCRNGGCGQYDGEKHVHIEVVKSSFLARVEDLGVPFSTPSYTVPLGLRVACRIP